MDFTPHGSIDFLVSETAIVNRPNRTFNEEGINAQFARIYADFGNLTNDAWWMIELLGKDAYPTYDALLALVEQYKTLKQKGCMGIRAVCQTDLQTQFLTFAAKKADVGITFFDEEKDALDYPASNDDS